MTIKELWLNFSSVIIYTDNVEQKVRAGCRRRVVSFILRLDFTQNRINMSNTRVTDEGF